MQSIGSTAAISEKDYLSAGAQGRGGFLRELRDAGYEFIGKILFNTSAVFQLTANFVIYRKPCAPNKERFCLDGA
jgi:hypothetical protein